MLCVTPRPSVVDQMLVRFGRDDADFSHNNLSQSDSERESDSRL